MSDANDFEIKTTNNGDIITANELGVTGNMHTSNWGTFPDDAKFKNNDYEFKDKFPKYIMKVIQLNNDNIDFTWYQVPANMYESGDIESLEEILDTYDKNETDIQYIIYRYKIGY